MLKALRKSMLRQLTNRVCDLETAIRVLLTSPSYSQGDGIGFNGLAGRKAIFNDLIKTYDFSHIIETGTFIGDTAGYMSQTTGLPVVTCEANEILFLLAKKRLKESASVSVINSDSRVFLDKIGNRPEIVTNECFLYLDAHWGRDCPLREEVDIVASRWGKFVVMIDDFQVQGDDGYGYDRYGFFSKLNVSLLLPVLKKYDLSVFFPKIHSKDESQTRPRGCVILSKNDEYGNRLKGVPSLRGYTY